MRYSYMYKRKCVELYRQGKWTETPEWIKNEIVFHDQISNWTRFPYVFETNRYSSLH